MAMDLPDSKGTYVLISCVKQMKRLEIGRLGAYDIVPGFYAYVGSAFGSGGLRARLGHHLESTATPHWHIDYLLGVAEPVEVWYTTANQKLEHPWADLLERTRNFRIPIARFGSSDYHRSRSSHLFFSKRAPSFESFRLKVAEELDCVEAECYRFPASEAGTTEKTHCHRKAPADGLYPPAFHGLPLCLVQLRDQDRGRLRGF